jgi:hypothetical protein
MFKQPKTLLTVTNAKTVKGQEKGYLTFILYMAPHTTNDKGANLCPYASNGCRNACLYNSGRAGVFNHIQKARINKANYFLFDRVNFFVQLKNEVQKSIIYAEKRGFIPVFRLNGTTDISFEAFKVYDGKSIFETFPDVQFYDYTKNFNRYNKPMPKNYHLTFSRSETNHDMAMGLLHMGHNVAMVFDGQLPTTYKGFKVINGDENDLRFLDKRKVIVGLKFKRITVKGGAQINKDAITSGFVLRTYKRSETFARINKIYGNIDIIIKRKQTVEN